HTDTSTIASSSHSLPTLFRSAGTARRKARPLPPRSRSARALLRLHVTRSAHNPLRLGSGWAGVALARFPRSAGYGARASRANTADQENTRLKSSHHEISYSGF